MKIEEQNIFEINERKKIEFVESSKQNKNKDKIFYKL